MAPLASIPEGNHSQPLSHFSNLNDSKKTHRPHSRIFAASRRHTRTRYHRPERTENLAARPFVSQSRAPERPTKSTFETIHTTPEATSEEPAEPSDSSFDLDSFPIPPSTSSTASSRHIRPPASSGSSASITTHGRYLNQRYRLSKSRHYRAQFDGTVDPSSSSARASVDSALVDAIARNIVQQFRLSSVGRYRQNQADANAHKHRPDEPRESSQQDAVDRFAKDLERYARHRAEREAAVPRKQSAVTLRTVSALMPFRSEFETAGLAVTSKDQANRIDSYITKAVEARARPQAGPSRMPKHLRPAAGKPSQQVDGFDDTEPSDSPNTEISFAPSKDMDEWRYAMIDEVPRKKKKKKAAKAATSKKPKKHCLSCFDHSPSTATEAGWTQPQKLPTAPMPKFHGGIGPPPPVPPPPVPPQRPPRPEVGLFDVGPASVPRAAGENLTSKSHALSPRMLPSYPDRKGKGKSPNIPRRGSPHPRILATKSDHSPTKKKRLSSKRGIPHETTSKQYDRTMQQATPLNLRTAVEEAKNSPTPDHLGSSRPPETLADSIDHVGICCRSSRGVPSRANARPNIPRRTSSRSKLLFSSRLDYDDREITDRDVLRGLHIAASAACDEEVDAFVRYQTGLRIRRFLADLMALESLAVNPPVDKKQWARQRRAEMRRLKQSVRRSLEINRLERVNQL